MSKEMFEEWFESHYRTPFDDSWIENDYSLTAWNHQQQKIDKLEARLQEAEKLLQLWQDYSDGVAINEEYENMTEEDVYDLVNLYLSKHKRGE